MNVLDYMLGHISRQGKEGCYGLKGNCTIGPSLHIMADLNNFLTAKSALGGHIDDLNNFLTAKSALASHIDES